jgi:signal transduction histidine kinase
MEYLNFPILALAAALVCLIGVSIYAIMQRGALRNRDEQLVVARAQAYAMLELSQAGVLFLDREHKLMGEASAAAPELLGHTCAPGTAFVQALSEVVDVHMRRQAVAYLESLWQADPTAVVDATANPLQRVHSGSRHLAIRFARLVVDGRVHHIIVSLERISAPRIVPHTIEVPVLNEDTFAKRIAGETGTRAALKIPMSGADEASIEAPAAEQPTPTAAPASEPAKPEVTQTASAEMTSDFDLGPLDVTSDSLPNPKAPPSVTLPALAQVSTVAEPANSADPATRNAGETDGKAAGKAVEKTEIIPALSISESGEVLMPPAATASDPVPTLASDDSSPLAETTPAPESLGESSPKVSARFDPAAIIEPRDPRLTEVLGEVMRVDGGRLEGFLAEARERAGQLRAILKLPAREPQAFREKLVLILELIRGIHARAKRLPLPSVCERAQRFEDSLNALRDRQQLSGNDFLPLAVKLDDLLSHLAIQGEVVTRLREWRVQNGELPSADIESTRRSATATGTTIRQPRIARDDAAQPTSATQKIARLSDLSQESLGEMAQFLADMYGKRVSLVVVGLEDVPGTYRRVIEKILGQLIHNAIRHGLEPSTERALADKPEVGTVSVQFTQMGADGFQLSVQDDGRGLDHDKIRAEAVRQGVLTPDAAANIDPRKLASLIFRPGFTTAEGGARGNGMDVVRDLVNKAGGRVGIATKPGEYTRFRVSLPHVKKNSDAAVA